MKNLEIYEVMVATQPDVPRKGKANPYTSLNGNMFSYLGKEGLIALRLPKEKIEELILEYETQRPVSYGAVMKEYLELPEKLYTNKELLEVLFKQSYAYAQTLKPKPTTKKK